MDGFHYYMKDLRSNKDGLFPDEHEAVTRRKSVHVRRRAFRGARRGGATASGDDDVTRVPAFRPRRSRPDGKRDRPKGSHKIVLVEGNYVLLPDDPWRTLRDENVLDESWFVDVAVDDAMRRAEARHVAVGRTPEEARRRADGNDRLNGELVERHKARRTCSCPVTTWKVQ